MSKNEINLRTDPPTPTSDSPAKVEGDFPFDDEVIKCERDLQLSVLLADRHGQICLKEPKLCLQKPTVALSLQVPEECQWSCLMASRESIS